MNPQPTPRLSVRLTSHELLDDWMRFRGLTNAALAHRTDACTSTIAHLRRGARKKCDADLAAKIEDALEAPTGRLFVAEVIDDWTSANRNGPPSRRPHAA